jgi:hypothetical protein
MVGRDGYRKFRTHWDSIPGTSRSIKLPYKLTDSRYYLDKMLIDLASCFILFHKLLGEVSLF